MSLLDEIVRHQRQRNLVSIRRDGIDANAIQGFVLGSSRDLVLLQYVYDFNLDGLMVLRVSDISQVRHSGTDKLQKKLLREEGLLEKVPFGIDLDLHDWRAVISQLSERHGFMIIECESGTESDFFIGRIVETMKSGVRGRYFSGAGRWSERPSEIDFAYVTACQVATNYINVYARHFQRRVS